MIIESYILRCLMIDIIPLSLGPNKIKVFFTLKFIDYVNTLFQTIRHDFQDCSDLCSDKAPMDLR